MALETELSWHEPWIQLTTSEEDWLAADPDWIFHSFLSTAVIRRFEEELLTLASEDLVNGPMHSSIGQEGGAVGSAGLLGINDAVNGSHRGHHQFLAKGMSYLDARYSVFGNTELNSPEFTDFLYATMAEILGLSPGRSGGRGGSMHLRWKEAGCLGTNAIVGGGAPLALGHAWAQKVESLNGHHTSDVTFTFFGDGATNIGSVLESMNLAASWKIPVCFFIENNMYAVSTHINEVSAETRLSARGPGFGIPSWRVDGMDPLAVKLATEAALTRMRSGGGPTIIEADVYRYYHQNGPFAGSAFGYRSKEEEREWRKRDPLQLLRSMLLELKIKTVEEIDHITSVIDSRIRETAARLVEGESPNRSIRSELWPSDDSVDMHIRSDGSLPVGFTTDPKTENRSTVKFSDAIARVIERRMETDDSVVVIGEDIQHLNGGTCGSSRGLVERFPDRVLGTPISENAFTGLAGGLAATEKFKPIVEYMFADFALVAADQLFNQVGKMRHMFGNTVEMPFVARVKIGIGGGYGSQHSMDPTSIFTNFPGWRVVAPSTPHEYVAAMNSALALNDPVAVLEHWSLYDTPGEIPSDDLDYFMPLNTSRVRMEGSGATVIAYLAGARIAEEALRAESLNVDLIDLRWLDAASIDWETIGESIKKTNHVLIVEDGTAASSYGAWLSHEIQSRFFDYLDHEVVRVTGAEAAPSISRSLEKAAALSPSDICRIVRSEFGVASVTTERM